LEVLRDCLPSSVLRTLRELPESLDETYERILKEIKKPNRDLAGRVLQCLVVATRPLRVAELAEVLAVDFDDAEGIPRLKPDWRWEEQELALLSACSSLIAIVEADDIKDSDAQSEYYLVEDDEEDDVEAGHSDWETETDDAIEAGDLRIVQFSHFSVKEFLTSPRLATASREVSIYHIDMEPAHTILAQACLGVLLQIQDDIEGCSADDHPLAEYAAEHWTIHAQFGETSSRLHKGMQYLFDPNKQHFALWLSLFDIDSYPNDDAVTFYMFIPDGGKPPAAPLYYAALCGFHDIAEHLITKQRQDVNADGGYYVRPLVAALGGEHFQTADLLRRNGADLRAVLGRYERSPLHAAAFSGKLEVVRRLIEYDPADINARDEKGQTPLHWASIGHNFKDGSVLRLLLEHGADINARTRGGRTPFHVATTNRSLKVLRLLLEHGADVEAKNTKGETALQEATYRRNDEVVEFLREHGAK
jgi:ankyrin repeat protein